MHLEAMRDVAFTVDGRAFAMAAGETIHTENSHKYGPRDARLLLRARRLDPDRGMDRPGRPVRADPGRSAAGAAGALALFCQSSRVEQCGERPARFLDHRQMRGILEPYDPLRRCPQPRQPRRRDQRWRGVIVPSKEQDHRQIEPPERREINPLDLQLIIGSENALPASIARRSAAECSGDSRPACR